MGAFALTRPRIASMVLALIVALLFGVAVTATATPARADGTETHATLTSPACETVVVNIHVSTLNPENVYSILARVNGVDKQATVNGGSETPFTFTGVPPGETTALAAWGNEWFNDLIATDPLSVNVLSCSTPPPPPPPADADGDGVPDSRDTCASTPAGAAVDTNGCAAVQRDGDGDGVSDAADQCPTQFAPGTTNGCVVVVTPPPVVVIPPVTPPAPTVITPPSFNPPAVAGVKVTKVLQPTCTRAKAKVYVTAVKAKTKAGLAIRRSAARNNWVMESVSGKMAKGQKFVLTSKAFKKGERKKAHVMSLKATRNYLVYGFTIKRPKC